MKGKNRGCLIAFLITAALGILVLVLGVLIAIISNSPSGTTGADEKTVTTEVQQDTAEPVTPVYIQGTVISVMEDGILVDNTLTHSVVFVKGRFDKADGDKIGLNAVRGGTYKYTSAIGSAKTVHAFESVKQFF